jgi:hypothetical protein
MIVKGFQLNRSCLQNVYHLSEEVNLYVDFGADMAYYKDQSSGVEPNALREQLETVRNGDYPFDVELHPDLPSAGRRPARPRCRSLLQIG